MPDIVDVTRSLMVIGLIFLLAFMLNHFIKRKEQRTMSARSAACILLLLIELLAFECDVSFRSGTANVVALAMAFPAYCILFIASRGIPQRWMRNAIGFAMLVPIGLAMLSLPILLLLTLPAYCILFIVSRCIPHRWRHSAVGFPAFTPIKLGLLLSPIPLLAGFMLFDDIYDSGPVIAHNQNYECRTYDSIGMFTSTYSVRLYRHWQFLPFFEYRVAAEWKDYADPDQVTCDDVVREYVQTHPKLASDLKAENVNTSH